ncbi:MAG TPA: glycosyltransferase family 4 protein [Patescibacteria group bacterium]|nr:glycosyltransferase family 4 protein [Patescibacteria group bacterium]
MSRPIRPSEALRRAIDDPHAALSGLATHRLRIFIRLTDGLGSRTRRIVGRLFLLVAGPVRPALRTGPRRLTARVLGLDWTTGRNAATSWAERVGRSPSTAPGTVLRSARLCLELGDPGAAQRVLAALSVGDDSARILLQAELDWQLGRYRRTAEGAARLLELRPGDREAARLLAWARSELTVLTPGWRPGAGPTRSIAPVKGRVLHLLTNSLPYRQAGYTVRSQDVGRCQLEAGLDPQMATRAGFPRSAGVRGAPLQEVVEGLSYWRLAPDLAPGTGPSDVVTRTVEAAAQLVERLRPAVLHPATNFLNGQAALALRDRYGTPVVYEVRGFLEETWRSRVDEDVADSDRYRAARDVETAVMRDADAIVTLSETMRADILGRAGVDADRVVVVPNAVDATRFLPGPRDEALAARLGLGDDPVIGYISSFTAYEGIVYLIKATAELLRRGRRVRCLLVGDGEERSALEEAARAAGLSDRSVVFTGRVERTTVQAYYRLIDVFVVPRTNDRVSQLVTPLKPYEAMAMERALVVSGVGALLEVVTDGETGRSFRPEDPVSLADVLEPLLDDPAERARLGQAARRWVVSNRSWQQNGARYRALYERLGVA